MRSGAQAWQRSERDPRWVPLGAGGASCGFYTFTEIQVVVVRVLHGRMDIGSRLSGCVGFGSCKTGVRSDGYGVSF